MTMRTFLAIFLMVAALTAVACGLEENQQPTNADGASRSNAGLRTGPAPVEGDADYEFWDRSQSFDPAQVAHSMSREEAEEAAFALLLARLGLPDIPEVRQALQVESSLGVYWGYEKSDPRPDPDDPSTWPVWARTVWLIEARNLPEFLFFYDPGPGWDREGAPRAAYVIDAESGIQINNEARGEGQARDSEAWEVVYELIEAEGIEWPTSEPPSGPSPTPTATPGPPGVTAPH